MCRSNSHRRFIFDINTLLPTKWRYCANDFTIRLLDKKSTNCVSNVLQIVPNGPTHKMPALILDNALAAIRRQAIVGTNNALVCWNIYAHSASLSLNVLGCARCFCDQGRRYVNRKSWTYSSWAARIDILFSRNLVCFHNQQPRTANNPQNIMWSSVGWNDVV